MGVRSCGRVVFIVGGRERKCSRKVFKGRGSGVYTVFQRGAGQRAKNKNLKN